MSPFKIGNIEFRYDTVVFAIAIALSTFLSSVFTADRITKQLQVSTRAAEARDSQTRRLLGDIVSAINDNRRLVEEMSKLEAEQHALLVKEQENVEKLALLESKIKKEVK